MQISRHGGPEELVLGEHPDPVPGPGDAEAHTRLASRTVAGKILLQAGSDE